jgi:hypothetical protein
MRMAMGRIAAYVRVRARVRYTHIHRRLPPVSTLFLHGQLFQEGEEEGNVKAVRVLLGAFHKKQNVCCTMGEGY